LLLISRLLTAGDWRTFAAFCLLCLTFYAVHPQPLFFLAIILAGLAVVRCALAMSLRPLGLLVLLGVPILAFALVQQATWHTVSDQSSVFTPGFAWREEFRLVHLPGDLVMGNYHLILHPVLLASIVLAPVLFWRARTSNAHHVLLVATVGWLPWLFVPWLTTESAKRVTSTFVIREPWMAPAGIVLAVAAVEAQRALARHRWVAGLARVRGLAPIGAAALPVVAIVLVLGAALVVQETYVRADGRAFYEWTSKETIFPWTDQSIFLGGKDRLFGREYRRGHREDALFAYLEREAPAGSLVMVPRRAGIFMPGVLSNVTPVYSAAPPSAPLPPLYVDLYYGGRIQGAELDAALREAGVDYVVVELESLAAETIVSAPGVAPVAVLGEYQLFVLPEELS
jgi:hypothetical protein